MQQKAAKDTAEKPSGWKTLRWNTFLAELLATALLVYSGGYVVLQLDAGKVHSTDVALVHGVIVGVLIYILGRYYVPQFNPAISITAWIFGRQNWLETLLYVFFQLLGSVAGAAALRGIVSQVLYDAAAKASVLGFPQVMADSNVGATLLNEIIYSFLYAVLFFIITADRKLTANVLFLALGGTVTFSILAAAPNNATALNPARVFGPAVISNHWAKQWVFYLGPFIGALSAGVVYWLSTTKFGIKKKQPTAEGEPAEDTQGFVAEKATSEIKVDYNTFVNRPLFA